MSKILDFRRRTRPGWVKPDGEATSGKHLKGLNEFARPSFVGRMDRVRRQRQLTWYAVLIAAVLSGAAIGWTLA